MLKISTFALLLCSALCSAFAQKGPSTQVRYGPVVSAYLINIDEELNELEFQLKQVEISPAVYSISRQRLLIQRQWVERHVASTGEDLVPEIQIMTTREVSTMLGLNETRSLDLKIGEVLAGKWEVAAVERRPDKFYVLSRRNHANRENATRPRPDINDVIETITVYEPDPEEYKPVQPQPPPRVAAPPPPQVVEIPRPLIRSLYLPQYTKKARENKVEGKVILSAVFTREGSLKDVSVEQKLGYGLDENAVDAARQLIFEPVKIGGQAVDIRARVIYTYTLAHIIATIQPVEVVGANGKGGLR